MIRRIAIVVLTIAAVVSALSLSSSFWSRAGEIEKGKSVPGKNIEQVLNEKADEWMAIPGVEGTAVGMFEGKPCIKVFTSRDSQELQSKIPLNVENHPVIIEETGTFRALDNP